MSEKLETAISGSFKFKPETDAIIDEFRDYNVTVLEPTKGWLYVPLGISIEDGWRPLPSERGLDISEVEDNFLAAIYRSDFLYVNNEESYVGETTALEIGYALARKKLIFCRNQITLENMDGDLIPYYFLRGSVLIASPKEAAETFSNLIDVVRESRT